MMGYYLAEWLEVKKKLPSNAELILKQVENYEYSKEVSAEGERYDIIIIDGVDRNNCVYESVNALTEKGVIIFDNSERSDYIESINFLLSNGFRRIDFWGMCPVTPINSCTSVFYKEKNCLGI